MNLRKIIISIFLSFILMYGVNVNAACAVGANVSNEFVCLVNGASGSNSNGTAYSEDTVLVLNNYSGGSISFSSGLGNPINGNTIKLIGDNYINALDNYGILMSISGINFIGDGTLTIKSKLPFATIDMGSQNTNYVLGDTVSEIKIISGSKINENTNIVDNNTEVNDNDTEENTSDEKNDSIEQEKENDSNLVIILLVICCSISFICLVSCIIFMLSNKKKM